MVTKADYHMIQIETYFAYFKEDQQRKRFVLSTGKYDTSVQELISMLSVEEKQLLQNFKVASRQNEFITGRVLAKNGISIFTDGLALENMNIAHGVWGFPLFIAKETENMWVSIAHSKRYAASIVSDTEAYPIGVDIEEISNDNESSLAHFLMNYDVDLSLEEKHIYWAAKEAIAKALRTGFTIPEHLFEISEMSCSDTLYTIKFKHLVRLRATAWVKNQVVTCIAYPTELEFDSIQKHNFSITNT